MSFLPDAASAVAISIRAGLWCAALGAPPAVALGWVLARGRFRGKQLLATAVLAPLVLPPVVTGVLLLELVGARGPVGRALAPVGLSVPFTFAAVVLSALIVSLPLYVMLARGAFEAVDPRYEELSRTLGRAPWPTFLRVSLPLALPGLLAGALLAFARALGEFGATAVLAGNIEGRTRTISLAIYTLLDSPRGDEAVSRLLWASLGLTFAALAGADLVKRRQRARLGEGDAAEKS